ncbi:MAG TPA: hypothetical protein VGC99_28140 [Candidatus Tectomicrobia bacterium]
MNWKRPDRKSIAGGVLADGLGCSIGGALGVVGISLLLGLTHETLLGVYQTLPSWLQLSVDSILSIATISAVLLNLLFRIGIRKTSTATIETDQGRRERLESMIRQEGKTWGVASDILEEANATAREIFNLIKVGHLADGPLTARIRFDEVSFVVDIHYSGDLFRLPTNRPHSDEDLLEEPTDGPWIIELSGRGTPGPDALLGR